MPILRVPGKLLYFAHVPKCAGTAVEGYLGRRFGRRNMGFLDPGHYAQPEVTRWTRSSPQHVEAAALERLFPDAFFDAAFTVVRHPALRLRSVFLYQRDVERRLKPETAFSAWASALPELWEADPFYLDNHTRPGVEIVPEGAEVFRLEAGLAPLVGWLDAQAGTARGPREIGVKHTRAERLDATGHAAGPPVVLSPADIAWIAVLYAEDYARFGYPEDPAEMEFDSA